MQQSRFSRSVWLAILLLPVTAWAGVIPSYQEVRKNFVSSDGKLLDRQGRVLQEVRLQHGERVLDWVELKAVSPSLQEAVLFLEDRRFYEHSGVDYKAVAGAIWQNLFSSRARGASTISMQAVKFLEEDAALRNRHKRSIWEKFRQTQLAWELEESWSKEQIFEAYLNLVPFRGELRGVQAAARSLYGKDAHGLNQKESFLLAALLKSPSARKEKVAERMCLVASLKPELGGCDELRAWTQHTLELPRRNLARESLAPHLAKALLSKAKPIVRSTLDLGLQRAVHVAVQDQLRELSSQNAQDVAVIVVKNSTGEVLSYVGGAGAFSASPHVDMGRSFRQAGSTLKPFLFAEALEQKIISSESWLLDEPFEIPLERGSYRPENYDRSFHGPVRAKEALASSLNIPAVRLVDLLGVEAFHRVLEDLGFRDLREAEFYGPSLALGSVDVTLLDLVNAYRTLANGGLWSPLLFSKELPVSGKVRRVFSKITAQEITQSLSDRSARALTFGWDSVLSTPYATAVKTGTSKDMRDNWCVGYSADYTVAVWMGNSSGASMWQVSGVSGAAPIWRAVMNHLHKNYVPKAFPLVKSEPTSFQSVQFVKILYPPSGLVLALDPDIPMDRQRIPLEAEGDGEFRVNGEAVKESSWQVRKGRHRIAFHSFDGKLLDETWIEVK